MDASDSLPMFAPREKPALPAPTRRRWQPIRLGLVELFHYDSEEFWFHDGHLLLRGDNGAGKSKVLSLTMPLLFDAQLKPSRIEPDGDPGKKMAWNLLMNRGDRRVGYAWIEFGRIAEDGAERLLTLGAGLSASAARPQVDSWFFLLEDAEGGPRINRDIWLTGAERVVLTRERLRSEIEGHGQVFDSASSYRRAVDERLFHHGSKRYDALMNTLVQLRQPQLLRKPDEASLPNALTEALPPLTPELLANVAEALGQLEEDRRQLDDYQALAKAVERFDKRYRIYAGTQSRRQAKTLRQAQTEFDNASRARSDAQARLADAQARENHAKVDHGGAELALFSQRTRLDTLLTHPAMQDANRLDNADKDARAHRQALAQAEAAQTEAHGRLQREAAETRQRQQRAGQAEQDLANARQDAAAFAEAAGIASAYVQNVLATLDGAALLELASSAFKAAEAELGTLAETRREQIGALRQRHTEMARISALYAQHQQAQEEKREAAQAAFRRRDQSDADVERLGQALVEAWTNHFVKLTQLRVVPDAPLDALSAWVINPNGDSPAQEALQAAQQDATRRLAGRRMELVGQREGLEGQRQALEAERRQLEAGVDAAPPSPHTRAENVRTGRVGAPFWRLVDFREQLDATQRAGLESALEAAGLLDAWVSPDGRVQAADGELLLDTQIVRRSSRTASLAEWLRASIPPECVVPANIVEELLAGVAGGERGPFDAEDVWIALDGCFRLGALLGAWTKPVASYIGATARAAARADRLAELATQLAHLNEKTTALRTRSGQHAEAEQQAEAEWRSAPRDQILRQAHLAASAGAREYQDASERRVTADALCRETERTLHGMRLRLAFDAADLRLPETPEALPDIERALHTFNDARHKLIQAASHLRQVRPELDRQWEREQEADQDFKRLEAQAASSRLDAEEASTRFLVLKDSIGAKVGELKDRVAEARDAVSVWERTLKTAAEMLRRSGEDRAVAHEKAQAAEELL